MPQEAARGWLHSIARHRGLIFPVLIVASVLVILAPLPTALMDLLLAGNITLAVVILLTTIYVKRPLEFSVFPAILLGTTLARLVLNVATTRLILQNGSTTGTRAAGGVIEAFGQFVAGGNLAIGVVLFAILLAIQFLVITKGATRISEVAARFALDGMPGKQMAIDADLSAGVIDQQEARRRREDVAAQADFYGAMDGASKFVRGDAMASVVITIVNIVGGLYVGVVQQHMPLAGALEVFTTLTIGDGLVTQVPAFLISLAAGLIVTRTSLESDLPRDATGQLAKHPEVLFLAAGFLVSLSFTGLPALPLIGLASLCAVTGITLLRAKQEEVSTEESESDDEVPPVQTARPAPSLHVDPLTLELGVGLIRLADTDAGGDLLARVTNVRHSIAQELGIIVPKVRIRDNLRLPPKQYEIRIRDVAVAWGEAYVDALLAVDTAAVTGDIPGIATTEPAFGRSAKWIEPALRARAESLGYSVVEPAVVLMTHLSEVIREHSAELLTRQQVHQLLDGLKQNSPRLVEELVPGVLKSSHIHQVLNNLLRERVPIRDLESILETLGDYADRTQDVDLLTEYVRCSLARTICNRYRDSSRVLHVVTLDPALEDVLAAGFDYGERGLRIKLSPRVSEAVVAGLGEQLEQLTNRGRPQVVLCSPTVRPVLKYVTKSMLPKLAVISLNEVTRDTNVESHGLVTIEAVEFAAVAAA